MQPVRYRFPPPNVEAELRAGDLSPCNSGGDTILAAAREVLTVEFSALLEAIEIHTPDESQKRHGQAIGAASLPKISR